MRLAGYLQGGIRGGQRAAGRLGAVDSPFGQFRGSGHHRVDDQWPEEPAEGRVSHEAAQVQRRGRIDELPHSRHGPPDPGGAESVEDGRDQPGGCLAERCGPAREVGAAVARQTGFRRRAQ